jgi:hypothetical protein
MIITESERKRFQAKVAPSDHGCLVWTGSKDPDGYGRFRVTRNGNPLIGMAHRVAYEHTYGQIPIGLTVDHLCFVPACVNPDHLRLLTRSENSANIRGVRDGYCRNGRHKKTPENTIYRAGHGRQCQECERARIARSSDTRRRRRAA